VSSINHKNRFKYQAPESRTKSLRREIVFNIVPLKWKSHFLSMETIYAGKQKQFTRETLSKPHPIIQWNGMHVATSGSFPSFLTSLVWFNRSNGRLCQESFTQDIPFHLQSACPIEAFL
jgi:hypothetical protein